MTLNPALEASPRGLDPAVLMSAWDASSKRPFDLAEELGVSECALLQAAARAGEPWCRWLDPERIRDVLMQLPALGQVMALTRNHAVVHEKIGRYGQGELEGHVGLIIHEGIDLRLFLDHWCHMVAVDDCPQRGLRASLQWFDAGGTAVHKVYLRPESDRGAFDAIVASALSARGAREVAFELPAAMQTLADGDVDRDRLLAEWAGLQDTHDFQSLLRRYRISREQALRLAPPRFARRVSGDALEATLAHAACSDLSIMVFVRNRGCVQIHRGPIRRLEPMATWLNVLDPEFNLHVRRRALARLWVVRKPTRFGVVSALEAYDSAGDLVLTLFGDRPAREPEPRAWQAWIDQLADAMPPC
ncbi:MAG: hemin-degrading factor [Gammaproteobacteria bacterium]|nr:MAG: hemin-degrading factor [Gammaproteobacteria bacterium]